MWDFEHPPCDAALAERYRAPLTLSARCAPKSCSPAAPTSASSPSPRSRRNSPSCPAAPSRRSTASAPSSSSSSGTASRRRHRPLLAAVRTVAADTASRSSLAYAQSSSANSWHRSGVLPTPADPIAMLAHADAALLIGDPALLALEDRAAHRSRRGPCLWLDMAHQWRTRTGLPWVAAVWAVRPNPSPTSRRTTDRRPPAVPRPRPRHIDSLVAEWTPASPSHPRPSALLAHQHPLHARGRLHRHHRTLPPLRRRN